MAEHAVDDTVSHSADDVASHSVEGATANCGGLSFAFATTVATAQGKQAIGTMHPGEQVWAYNPKTKQMELQPVLHVWINHDNDLIDLTLSTSTHAPHSSTTTKVSDVIHTNKKHPFLTEEKGFIPVGQLKVGMHVREADGLYGIVTGWKLHPGTQMMYNLEVAQDHTFTVGDEQWIVHNCGATPYPQQADLDAKGLSTDGIVSKNGIPDKFGRSRTTIGVAYVQDASDNVSRIVSMNSNSMSRWGSAVRSLISTDEWVPSQGPGLHAEQNLYRYATSNGLEILGLGASRNICSMCWSELTQTLTEDLLGTPRQLP